MRPDGSAARQNLRGPVDVMPGHQVADLEQLVEVHGLKQAGGHAVAHRVGDVKAEVLFVEAKDVVKIAADPAAGLMTAKRTWSSCGSDCGKKLS